ncbi:MAG TPA: nuclear transport factor 2 family protein [Gemmatimonadales bacterium]|nr:nuclear transport factor 2 family protein [Gemmatimonadales bacterium]
MRTYLLALALLAAPAAAAAQAAPDQAAILKAVQTTFDGMRTHDTLVLKQAVLADASFMTVGKDRDGKPRIRRAQGQEFIDAVGKGGEPWNEVIMNPEVRQDGDLAMVWAYYTFKLGDKPSHCGYDLFTLAKMDGAWKVVAIADTQRREGCQF